MASDETVSDRCRQHSGTASTERSFASERLPKDVCFFRGRDQPFASSQIDGRSAHFCLAFPGKPSDQSSCANQAQKGFTIMKTAEATTTEDTTVLAEHAASVAEQSVPVAPEKTPPKKGATQKKGEPKGQKAAKGGKAKPRPRRTPRPVKRPRSPPPLRKPARRAPRARGRRSWN